ncbi:MAG TPA: flagellar basal body rod protein FlgB [Gaiellales bacterium]|jgi:flagellar basal-body rod protein FlgB|nr:flagellar basal body rod protein FlgB [Gaiellales bacterium]
MGLFDLTDLALQQALSGAGVRQQLLANNLANVNTPGFKRSDVDFESSLASALSSGDPSGEVGSVDFQPQVDTTSSMRADGNNVSADQELSNMTQNAIRYEALAAVEKSRLEWLHTAIGAS